MEDRHCPIDSSEAASTDPLDGRTSLSADELEEIREALHLLRALRTLVKTGAIDVRGPVKATRTVPSTDEQYAKAVANVTKRIKGGR